MKKILTILFIAVLALAFASCSGPPKKSRGTVKSVDLSEKLLVAQSKNKTRKFHLTDETKYFSGENEIKAEDLKPGDRVQIEFKVKGKKERIALSVKVFAVKPATKEGAPNAVNPLSLKKIGPPSSEAPKAEEPKTETPKPEAKKPVTLKPKDKK